MLSEYKLSFLISLVLHSALIVLSAFSWQSVKAPSTEPAAPVEIIQAITVDEVAIQTEMKRIQAERQQQQAAELARQQELERKAAQAKKQREAEAKRLAELEAQTKKIKQQQEQEMKRLANLKAQAKAAEQKRQEEEKRQAELQQQLAQRQAALQKKLEEEQRQQAQLAAEKERQLQEIIQRYGALIKQAIGQQWIIPDNVERNLSSTLLIRLAPGGSVVDVQLIQSSGHPQLDRSAIAAVYKASPLPVPREEEWFEKFREVKLTVRPEEVFAR